MPNKTSTDNPKRIERSNEFRQAAYSDYVSSRLLLRNVHLEQGVILASTCVEKYFKSYLAVCGRKRDGHLCKKLMSSVFSLKSFPKGKINQSFILWLAKMYKMRYLDNLPNNYKEVISRNNTLAELDRLVALFERTIVVEVDGVKRKSYYDHQIEQNNEEICGDNWTQLGVTQKEFVEDHEERVLLKERINTGCIETFILGGVNASNAPAKAVGIYEEDFSKIMSSIGVKIIGKKSE